MKVNNGRTHFKNPKIYFLYEVQVHFKLTEEFKNQKWKPYIFSVNTKFKIIRFDMGPVRFVKKTKAVNTFYFGNSFILKLLCFY